MRYESIISHRGVWVRSGRASGAPRDAPQACTGMTLIEVMVAILILTVLSLCGSQVLTQAHSTLYRQAQRRTALELASGRVEALRASAYASVNQLGTSNTVYLSSVAGGWVFSPTNPHEILTVHGTGYTITTLLTGRDVDGLAPLADCLQVTVTVTPVVTGGVAVSLSTILAQLDS